MSFKDNEFRLAEAGIQTLHRVVRYAIVPVFILQTFLGLFATGIFGHSAL